MLKRLAPATRITTAILMVVSILIPTSVAEAANITKLVTVLGVDGQPYAGAWVALGYGSTTGALSESISTTPVQTNAQGVATLTFSDAITQGDIHVQPPASDTATAAIAKYDSNYATSAALTIQLVKADYAVALVKADGSPILGGGGLFDGYNQFFRLDKQGAVGLSVPANAAEGSCQRLVTFAADADVQTFGRRFAIKIFGTGSSRAVKVFTDPKACANEVEKVNGVYQLKLYTANISGFLKSNTGQALSFAAGEGYLVNRYSVDSDGTKNFVSGNIGAAEANGAWFSYVDTSTAGKHEIVFSGYGNTNYPTFGKNYVYVTADHKLSWNADGSSPADQLTKNYNVPLSNIQLNWIETPTSVARSMSYTILPGLTEPTNYDEYAYGNVANGVASAYLVDGDYRITLNDYQDYSKNITFKVSVSGSTVTLVDASAVEYRKNGNIFTAWAPEPNTKIKFVDSSGNSLAVNAVFCTAQKACSQGMTDSSGFVSLNLPNGNYTEVSFQPTSTNAYSMKRTTATVSSNVFNLATGVHESDGSWTVQLPAANLKMNAFFPNNSPLYSVGQNAQSLGYLYIYSTNSNWENMSYVTSPQVNSQGGAAATLANGYYIMDLNLQRSTQAPENNGFANRRFRVTVSGGVATVSSDGTNLVADSDGVFKISPYVANLDVIVKDDTGTVFTSGDVQVWDKTSNGSRINNRGTGIGPNGHAYFYFNSSLGEIVVNPSPELLNLAGNTYGLIYGNDSVTVVNSTKVDGAWVIKPSVPNIKVLLINPKTNVAMENAWVSVERVNDNWEWQSWLTNIEIWPAVQGNGRAYLPNGKYTFTVNPSQTTANAGLAAQVYRVVASESGLVVTLNGSTIQPVDGKYRLMPVSSNFEMLIKKANGTIFTNGWVNYCKVVDVKNSNCIPGEWIHQDGRLSAYLSDGTWQVTVHPQSGVTDATEKTYEVVVTSGVPAVTNLQADGDGIWTLITGTPNLSGTLSLASGSLVFGNNQNVNLQVQKLVNGNWQYQNGWAWTNTTSWAMTLTATLGEYRLVARPYGFSDLVESYSNSFWVNQSGLFSATQNGTYAETMTALNIVLRSPNLKFKVVNPLAQSADPNYLVSGGWISIEKVINQGRTWITNADIQPANPGLTGANITEAGSYVLRVNPPNGSNSIVGLASKDYQMTIVSADSVTVTSGGVEIVKDSDGRFVLRLATANVTARILRTDGTPATPGNNKWVGVNLQKLNAYGDWEWGGWANTDDNGYVSLRVETAGKYRLRIEPYGDPEASITYSTEFTVTADQVDTLDKKFGSITLAGPSIRVSVAASTAPTVAIANTNIEIRKDGRWIDWANTGQGGVAGISLTSEGTYEFTVHPNQEQLTQAAKKTYKVVATKNSDGQIVATVTAGTGVSVSGTVTTLLLGTPTLVGTVKDPDGVTLQADSQVYAVDLASGSEKWDYSVNTNNNGVWSMILPAGRYKIFARAPWGTSTYGSSAGIGEVVVAENGTVTTPAGYPANAFEIRLKAPTWSGTVKAPTGDTVIPGARVCLLISNIWNCTNADTAGHFALSMADTFNSFSNTNPILDIADDQGRNYPMNRIQGESNVSTALNGTSSNSVVLRLKAPNTEITVTPSEGTLVASNLWVVAERDGIGYLGSGTTDMNGVAKLNIDQPSLPFKVRVEVTGNQEIAANFAPATRTYTQQEITNGTTSSVFRGSITLSPPNFRFIVREPTTAGTAVGNTWVELLGGNDGPWLGGTSVDFNGFGNFKLDVPQTGVNNYVMIVNPAWNATTNFTRQAYAVTVASSGNITVTNKTSVTEVRTQSASGKTVYPLALGIPSVTGIVVDPDSRTVANSWVVPFNGTTNEGYWQQGVTSRNDGSIAMNLAAGSYKLEANVPWGVSGVAKSAQCAVTVANGTISTGGSCVQSGTPNTVRLQLRAPNVKFTLKVGNSVIANANVGVGAGKWWTNAQSNSEGVVSLFIDAAAIRELNGSSSAQRLWFWVDPPYGSSTMARWSCGSTDNKPICKDLTDVPTTGDYVGKVSDNGSAWVVQGVTPNTRLKIVDPVTSTELANSWVSVMAMNSQGNQWWLGGGNSGIDGYVAMNIETETAFANGFNKLVLEVQAPWDQRTKFATNLYNYGGLGYTYESLTAVTDFSPATPNLKLVIKDSNNYINRYGWVGVEDVTNINATKWVGGYGLNEYGEGAIFLSASKTYRITSYPGPGRGGAATTCLVTTGNQTPPEVTADSAGCGSRTVTNGSLTIRLNGGNVVGTVTRADGTPVVGAAVYANIPGAATEASAVITVTDETGHYDLQLTAGQSWNLKVFPIPSTTDNLEIKTHPTAITAPAIGASTIDFTLAAVVG